MPAPTTSRPAPRSVRSGPNPVGLALGAVLRGVVAFWLAVAHGIGAVLVMDGLHPVGIFTERDVLRRIVAAGNSPEDTLLRDVMTRDLVFCSLDDEVDAVADIMRSKRIRHVPVLDAEGFVVGMVSIGDINAFRLASFEVALHQIESYVYSRN